MHSEWSDRHGTFKGETSDIEKIETELKKKSIIPMYFKLEGLEDGRNELRYLLAMYVNPNQLNFAYQKKITREQTLGGWAEFHWGQELTSINAEGVSGAFLDLQNRTLLSTNRRRNSAAWKTFESLFNLFRNNGVDLVADPATALSSGTDKSYYNWAYGQTNAFQPIGYPQGMNFLSLNYDDRVYYGYFESLNYKFSADMPYMLSYSFVFKVQREIDLLTGFVVG